jgi:hypothetical protein
MTRPAPPPERGRANSATPVGWPAKVVRLEEMYPRRGILGFAVWSQREAKKHFGTGREEDAECVGGQQCRTHTVQPGQAGG